MLAQELMLVAAGNSGVPIAVDNNVKRIGGPAGTFIHDIDSAVGRAVMLACAPLTGGWRW